MSQYQCQYWSYFNWGYLKFVVFISWWKCRKIQGVLRCHHLTAFITSLMLLTPGDKLRISAALSFLIYVHLNISHRQEIYGLCAIKSRNNPVHPLPLSSGNTLLFETRQVSEPAMSLVDLRQATYHLQRLDASTTPRTHIHICTHICHKFSSSLMVIITLRFSDTRSELGHFN